MELPKCMYPLPVDSIASEDLSLPRCMYPLQPIMPGPPECGSGSGSNKGNKTKEPVSVSALESRQDSLLLRLRQLQLTVEGVRDSLGMKDNDNNKAADNRQNQSTKKASGPLSLVVRASPSHPPYSLLCLISALKQRSGKNFVLQTTCHEHSSLQRPLPNSLREFLPESDACEDGSKVSLRISLIWKEVGRDVEMGLGLTVIRGETNVMRYAARCLGLGENCERTDALLDDCCTGLVWGDQKEQARVLKRLEEQLSKRPSVCESDSQPGLMDFAVYSALVNSSNADAKGAAAVKKWTTQCQALAKKGKGTPSNNNKKIVGKDSKSRKASSGGNPGRGWRSRTKSKSKSKTPPVASS